MSDDAASTTNVMIIVPPALRTQFPEVIELIEQSESMDTSEKQYWIDLLPMMSPEKIQELRDILVNERDQLAAIDAKYNQDVQKTKQVDLAETEAERTRKREQLSSIENVERTEATQEAEDILKQID